MEEEKEEEKEKEKKKEEEPPRKKGKAIIIDHHHQDDGGEKGGGGGGGGGGGFALIGEDIHRNILSRLPALSYAYAACVSRSWNRLCNQILSRPKLLSAISLNSCLKTAVNEALDKVLSEPIRPDFVIACVGLNRICSLEESHNLVRKRLSSRIPIISSICPGIFGTHVHTNEFKEIKWVEDNEDIDMNGIVVIVGFMPGMKVTTIPYLRPSSEPPEVSMIEKFVAEIQDYATSVSGCTSPAAIIMFADEHSNMEPVLLKMDYALSEETVIMGDQSGCFMYSNGDDYRIVGGSQQSQPSQNFKFTAVVLVFAMDKNKSCGVGGIQFNLAMSTGVSPVGPTFKGASVRVTKDRTHECSTWLTARREGSTEELAGDRIFQDIEEIQNDISYYDLYIGVTKRRKCSFGSRKAKLVSSLAFHEVLEVDEEYLYVSGEGIKTGDSFRFYKPDPEAALVSCNDVSEELKILKQGGYSKENGGAKKEVFGGIIFCCYGRGESFFRRQNVDSSAFLENYPGVPFGGIFCCGEIGRGSSSSYSSISNRKNNPVCCLHVYGTVYLVMSYTPKPL